MDVTTITAIGTFTDLTEASGDWLCLDPGMCTGTDDAPLRQSIEPVPGAHGVYIFPGYDDAQVMTLSGACIINSASDEASYRGAIEALAADLKGALNAMRSAPGNLVHGGGTISVWKNAPLEKTWDEVVCMLTFGLVVDVP